MAPGRQFGALLSLALTATILLPGRPYTAAVPVRASAAESGVLLVLDANGGMGRGPVDVSAFRGQGELAFEWHGHPYLLDGAHGRLVALPSTGRVSQLAWSPDGRWLAYLDTGPTDCLRLMPADGGVARVTAGLPAHLAGYQWLGSGATLAVTGLAVHGRAEAWLLTPAGRARHVTLPGPWGLFSPDGSQVAWTTIVPAANPLKRGTMLYTAPIGGSASAPRLRVASALAELVGWWPDAKELLYFLDPQFANSLQDDGLVLYSLPLSGKPLPLETLLTWGDWRVPSSSGTELLLVAGNDREVWHNKQLSICTVTSGACRSLPRQPGTVAIDPAWSPDGSRIAFVQARDLGLNSCCIKPVLQPWLAGRTLWVADGSGRAAHQIAAAGHGVSHPQWSGDGRHLLFWRDNTLWIIDLAGGQPRRVIGPFPVPPEGFGFYGKNEAPSLLAWARQS